VVAVLVGITKYSISNALCALFVVASLTAQEQLYDIRQVASAREFNLRGELINIAISPANPDIVSFESVEGGNLHRLWWLDLNTKHLEQITPRTSDWEDSYWRAQSDRDIDWCPVKINGKTWFLFVSSGLDGQENIYLGNTEDNYYLRLTSSNYVDHHPRWSPDGKHFVYVSSRRGSGDIYFVNNIERLINRFERAIRGEPESREIVLDGISSGNHHIRLTENPRMDSFPDWSPDGRYLVYQGLIRSDDVLHMDLFLLDMHNSTAEPINLTQNPRLDAIQPKWSYDRRNIAYYVSPAGFGGEMPSTVHLSYVELSGDTATGEINSFVTKGTIDANIRRNNNAGPLWGPGSRSLLYVKGEGNYTPILMYSTTGGSMNEAQVIRESRYDIIHREIAGQISNEGAVIAYLTYEDQDYRIYTARPGGGILSRRLNDVYVQPVVWAQRFKRQPTLAGIGGQALLLFNQKSPARTRFDFVNSFSLQYTVIPYVENERPYEFAVRANYGSVRPSYRTSEGGRRTFSYSIVDIGGVLSIPVDRLIDRMSLFAFTGLGMVFSYDDIARPSISRRINLPFGFGLQYSVSQSVDITGQLTFRNLYYLNEEESEYVTLHTRGLGFGVLYNI